MKEQPLIIAEHHLDGAASPEQVIRENVTAWLTKELHK